MNDPQLSLVIASNRGGPALIDTIAAFAHEDAALDIVIAESARDGSREAIQARFPRATVLHFDERRTLPELRAAGLLAAPAPARLAAAVTLAAFLLLVAAAAPAALPVAFFVVARSHVILLFEWVWGRSA
jgi:hypothetical protein